MHVLGHRRIVNFLNDDFYKNYLTEKERSPLVGLKIMFDYYVQNFFISHDGDEPGPKGAFPIMSRIKFCDMFRRLSDEKKKSFISYVKTKYKNYQIEDAEFARKVQRKKDLEYLKSPYEKKLQLKKTL